MATSGTADWNPTVAQLAQEAFERVGIRPPEIDTAHLISAQRSMNLILTQFSVYGVNLWRVELFTIPLIQGVSTYDVDPTIINIQDAYLRLYQMGVTVDVTPAFATTNGSPTVTVTLDDNGLTVGMWIQVVVPVAVGGIVIQGFYQVVSVIDGDTFTITAADNATSLASGGTVPQFTTTALSTSVSVALTAHGYLSGETFAVQVPTTVGGITFSGDYTISSITSANAFVITAGYAAGSSASGYENAGEAQISSQSAVDGYTDRLLGSMSRTDYASIPNKTAQAPPNVFWFDKLLDPTVTLWQVPDQNGPYELRFYANTRIQDAEPVGSQTMDLPFRFYEAFCARLAAHIAMKWAPDRAIALKGYGDEQWQLAIQDDVEISRTSIYPNVDAYFR